jgi:VWFA-related protein
MVLALLLSLFAQTKFGTSVEVRVVNLDVVVTDKNGNRVSGLTKDDFEVLEDGKRQTITNFYEARTESPAAIPAAGGVNAAAPQAALPPEPRQRRFVFFIDNDSLTPVVRKHFFTGLRKFIDTHLRPGDQTSVISWSRGGLQIAAPLTSDLGVLRAAIDAVEAAPSPNSTRSSYVRVRQQCLRNLDLARSGRLNMGAAYADCINVVRQETSVMVNDSRLLMNAINVAMTIAAGAEGKKVLVLAGASLPQKPGYEMVRYANMLFVQMMRSFDAPNAQNSEEDEKLQKEMIERLARSANAHGVTLYTIDAPTTVDGIDIQSKMGGQDYGIDFLRMENTEAAFGTLTEMTGGMALYRPGDFGEALGRVAADLDSYYSIGYRPGDDIGRDRNVVVRAKNRDYVVRTRQTYAPKSAEDQMTDRVIANIYAPAKSEIPVTIRVGTPQRADKGNFTVPIEVSFPPTLTLLPEEGKLAGGFTTYIAVGNKQGVLSTTSRSPQPVLVPVAEEAAFLKSPIVYGVKLTIKPGENLVSIAVVDQLSRVAGFARTTIVTPEK